MAPSDSGAVAYARFAQARSCPVLAVVDPSGRPVGLIERNDFLTRLASQYGRAVYGPRPVVQMMTIDPIIVEADMRSGDFAEQALKDAPDALLKGFIITERGRYLGVGAVIDLLRAAIVERANITRDLSELTATLRDSNAELDRQRRLAETVIEHIPALITVRSESTGRRLMINSAGLSMLDAKIDNASRAAGIDLVLSAEGGRRINQLETFAAQAQPLRPHDFVMEHGGDELHGDRRKGQKTLRVTRVPMALADGERLSVTLAEDVTEMRLAASRIEQLAHFDTLTGLANRAHLNARIEAMLSAAREPNAAHEYEVALLAIDLDRFKWVNDTLGHDAGDLVLREVARRLTAELRAQDMPARLGGDEFAVAIAGAKAAAIAETIASRLVEQLGLPYVLGEKMIYLGASIGIATFPADACDLVELMKCADLALYKAKADGKNTWRRFSASLRAGLDRRSLLESELRLAMQRGQFLVHLQPIFHFGCNAVSGFEALMRWHHPEFGSIPPATFIPMAEEIGLIDKMGCWVLHEACRIAATLPEHLTMAVNISAVQFRLPSLASDVARVLERWGLPPERLELEITESVLIGDEAQALRAMKELQALGVRIALDDFGTGYASFSYLQKFPFDRIKIDRLFTQGILDNRSSMAIVSALAILAEKMDMRITAEGVETQAQLDAVRRLGCTEAQGYLIGRPGDDVWAHLPQDLV
ncbi:MAG TPA: EAL domain-containing protein [Novosphingobium sp.]|nr:EAL domain-containing protein [Novosphingobium sp.]